MPYAVEFNRPYFVGQEFQNISAALARGHISGNGAFTRSCEELLEEELAAERVLLTTSCTHALEMAALLLEVGPGDEVVLPAYTFVSTANAFVLRGARPVFCDVRPDTLNLDEGRLEALLSPRTKVVVPIHYAGVGAELDAIEALCAPRGVAVVEDNAHGLFARYRGRPLGTLGRLGTLSFHETKNLICGEGGALVINDPALVERAEVVRDKGTDRARFVRGEVDRYTWVDLGSSYALSEVLAGLLRAQLDAREEIRASRADTWSTYMDGLAGWAGDHGVQLPAELEHCASSHHAFWLVLPAPERRDALIDHLRSRGCQAVFHYQPLHLSEMGRRFGGREGDCPVTERVCDRLLRLPFHNFMLADAQQRVIDAVRSFRP